MYAAACVYIIVCVCNQSLHTHTHTHTHTHKHKHRDPINTLPTHLFHKLLKHLGTCVYLRIHIFVCIPSADHQKARCSRGSAHGRSGAMHTGSCGSSLLPPMSVTQELKKTKMSYPCLFQNMCEFMIHIVTHRRTELAMNSRRRLLDLITLPQQHVSVEVQPSRSSILCSISDHNSFFFLERPMDSRLPKQLSRNDEECF
jgi:hypothetical protein